MRTVRGRLNSASSVTAQSVGDETVGTGAGAAGGSYGRDEQSDPWQGAGDSWAGAAEDWPSVSIGSPQPARAEPDQTTSASAAATRERTRIGGNPIMVDASISFDLSS